MLAGVHFRRAALLSSLLATPTLACTKLESGGDSFGTAIKDDASRPRADASSPGVEPSCGGMRPSETLGTSESALEISQDTTWGCDVGRLLAGDIVVRAPATLTIDAGVRVAAGPGAMLLVERGARLVAKGTREAPIVFTSAKAAGERQPGDWRGVILIGGAKSHTTNLPVYNTLDDARAHFGGGPNAADTANCGSLTYVRIEFAGGDTNEDSTPGAGLTFAGCGTDTYVEFVQVHRGTDGLGLIAGATPIKRTVVSNTSRGDAVEWTGGYRGNIQHLIAQSGAAAGLAGNNSESQPDVEPVSKPVIYNATVVGIRPLIENGAHYGVLFRHGSSGVVKNSIVANFANAGIDVRSKTVLGEPNADGVSHLLFWNNGPNSEGHWTSAAEDLVSPSFRAKDPGVELGFQRDTPVFKPTASTVNTDSAPIPAGFDATATYRGALPYDGDDWTTGWTEYPSD